MEEQNQWPERRPRRKDREISRDEARELLERCSYGVLSTSGPAGEPYGVPISYALHGEEIIFHCAVEGRKLEHLAARPRASFCVVGETETLPEQFSTRYESAIAEGDVRELLGEEKLRGLGLLVEKYSPEFRAKGQAYIAADQERTRVFAMCIRQLTGKRRR